jgi:hypothetical protein
MVELSTATCSVPRPPGLDQDAGVLAAEAEEAGAAFADDLDVHLRTV